MSATISARHIRILLAFTAFIAGGIPGGALGVAWPSMRDAWELPTAYLGILLLAITCGFLLGAFVCGNLVNRFGLGGTLILSSAVTTLGLLGFGLAPGWLPLIAVAALSGLGKGALGASLNLYFANHFNARLMNWLHASFGMGATLGPIFVGLAAASGYSWRIIWLAAALAQLLLSCAWFYTRAGWHSTRRRPAADAPDAPPMLSTLRQPTVLLGMALFFVLTGIELSAGSWSFTLFSETRFIDSTTAASWVSLYWGSFTLGRVFFGLVADKLPAVASIRILMLALLLGTLVFSQREPAVISLAGLIVIGIAQAPVTPLLFSITPEQLGEGHAINAIGFQMSATGLGFAALPALVGVLADFSSFEILGPFLAVSTLVSLLLFNRIIRAGASGTA